MIGRIKALFQSPAKPSDEDNSRDELQLAAAALLVEAAHMDEQFDDVERDTISAAISAHFSLTEEESAALLAEAEAAQSEAVDLHRFTSTINRRYEEADRIKLMEMLWEVVYADDTLDHYEANLIRRLGALLNVEDRARAEAKQRVLARRRVTNS